MPERLQKLISQWGVASRRQAEQLIQQGRVRLNGRVAQLGQCADPSVDTIEVDQRCLQPQNRPRPLYLLLHKPLGIVSACRDPQQRRTVLDLLPSELQNAQGIHPVGRLDYNSTGALLLTNDGELTVRLTHPRHHIAKTYHVWVQGQPSPATLKQWRQGIVLEGQVTRSTQVQILEQHHAKTLLELVLYEGRNRQIRKVAELLGHPVLGLHRVAIGPIRLASLPSGHWRYLHSAEIRILSTLAR